MAIDSSLFYVDLPAGSYAAGDVVELQVKSGPAVVRDGYRQAILKKIYTGLVSAATGSVSNWTIYVQNSDWIDPAANAVSYLPNTVGFSDDSPGVQGGNDCPLMPNSGWRVWAVCNATVTTTAANSIIAVIDIDYPYVSSVEDPLAQVGFPTTIVQSAAAEAYAFGDVAGAKWTTYNTDIFKAGWKYLLQKISIDYPGQSMAGFISLSNAAGMGGLSRIVPIITSNNSIRYKIAYSSVLTKGPMDLKLMLFGASVGSQNGQVILDFVKKR